MRSAAARGLSWGRRRQNQADSAEAFPACAVRACRREAWGAGDRMATDNVKTFEAAASPDVAAAGPRA